MSYILDNLIFDRTPQDVSEVSAIGEKIANGTATIAERSKWNSSMKGALSPHDLIRMRTVLQRYKTWLSDNNISFIISMQSPETTRGDAYNSLLTQLSNDVKSLGNLLKYVFSDTSYFSFIEQISSSELDGGVLTYIMYNKIEKSLANCRPNVQFKYRGTNVWYIVYWDEENKTTSIAQLLNANGYSANNIDSIAINSFEQTTDTRIMVGIENVYFNSYSVVINSVGSNSSRTIKSALLTNSVKTIGANAFERSNLTEIVIPDSVTSIGQEAFMSCFKLERATIGTGISVLPSSCFNGSGLQIIDIPNTVTEIQFGCFYYNTKLKEVNFGTGITKIGANAFDSCTILDNINYAGTKAQWGNITKGINAFAGINTIIVHCSDGDRTL